jgi:valyl-tRNA synthetase
LVYKGVVSWCIKSNDKLSWSFAFSSIPFCLQKEKQVLALLSKLDIENVQFTDSAPGGCHLIKCNNIFMQFANNNMYPWLPGDANQSVHIVADEGLEAYLPLADMVDVSEEVKRLSKRLSKMQSEYDALVARLNSQSVCDHCSLYIWLFIIRSSSAI